MKSYFTLFFLVLSLFLHAQSTEYARPTTNRFSFFAGFHAIDDDDIPFAKPFDAQTLNWAPYPAKVGVLYDLIEPFVIEGSFSFLKLRNNPANKYRAPYNCFGIDLNSQNHFYFYKKSEYEKFGISANRKQRLGSIYVVYGISANIKNQLNEDLYFNMNLGAGGNWWINRTFAINAQAVAQIGLAGSMFTGNANQLRYSLGIIYKG